jgi:hypothetical protein
MFFSLVPNPASSPGTAARTQTEAVQRTVAPAQVGELVRFLAWTALLTLPALVVIRPVDDWDIWWHLRTGQWIVAHGALPTTDPFTTYGQDQPWIAYSWLFDVTIYLLHQAFGLWGVVLYRTVLSFAVIAAVYRLVVKREPRSLPGFCLVGATLLAIAPLLNERSWLISILFTALTLDAILDLRDGRRTRMIWILPLLFLLWANLHIQFVYGLLLLALGCVAPLLDRLRGSETSLAHAAQFGSRGWWQLLAVLLACTVATLSNPYHLRIYGVVWEYATQPGPYNLLEELRALEFRGYWDWIVLGLSLSAAFALGRRRHRSAFEVLLLAGTAYCGFHTRRDLWFVVLAAVAILASSDVDRSPVSGRVSWSRPRLAFLGGSVLLVVIATAIARDLTPVRLEQAVADRFPAQAAAAVEQGGYTGPLYAHFNWGGYLIWRLPALQAAIDGRTNLHGDQRIQRCQRTWHGFQGWENDPDLNRASVVLVESTAPLAGLLRADPRFVLAYEDQLAVVFFSRQASEFGPASAWVMHLEGFQDESIHRMP